MMYRPFHIEGTDRAGRFVICCDHAANTVPPGLPTDLGLPPADMQRHIAYDIGAAGVSRALGAALNAPVICSNFSRLVIDPNRGEDDPTLLMKLYDGSIIPANRGADSSECTRRLDTFHRPYHAALRQLIAARKDPVLVSVHSFTPQLRGRPLRPWHVGILHASDSRLSDPLIELLTQEPGLVVGRNQPYKGHLPGDCIDQQALRHGHHNTLIEIRNDLIATEDTQIAWGARLAPFIQKAMAMADANP